MNMAAERGDNVYRLILGRDDMGDPRFIEFEAAGAYSALLVAARHCAGRKVEVFENGRSLGTVRSHAEGGYWVIGAPDEPSDRRAIAARERNLRQA